MKKILSLTACILALALCLAGCGGSLASDLVLPSQGDYSKLEELQALIDERFVGETDQDALMDGAAAGMIAALGDEWSYYISAEEYDAYVEEMSNSYVGVGMVIQTREDGYLDVKQVTEGGPAEEAGIQAGDILRMVNGEDCAELGITETRNRVRGEEGTTVDLTLERDGRELTVTVERRYFTVTVAEYEMVTDTIGLVSIYNFDDRCARETIAAIQGALDEGAQALIFDVRNNPGGYQSELVKVLDYLLPEGKLFISEYYDGTTEVDESDADCLEIPMAVLVNSESYSAAEFFAAALMEYDAAVIVGEQTYGKGYFQQTYRLSDGSAVGLSVGKYYTPNGVSLAGVGVTPDVEVPVDYDTFLEIYYDTLPHEEDPQIQAAIEALQ